MDTQGTPPHVMVVEDSDEDFGILQRLIQQVGTFDLSLHRYLDGDEALDALQAPKSLPDLILLDLNLPGMDGREVLAKLKQDDRLRMIPIVVLTTSSNPKDVSTCYRFGVNSYMLKSMDPRQFKTSIQQLLDFWFQATVLPSSNR